MDDLIVHYHRLDSHYENWTLWTWVNGTEKEIKPKATDDYGLVFELDLDQYPVTEKLNFIPKYKDWENKDEPDRHCKNTEVAEIWIVQNDPQVYTQTPDISKKVIKAFLDSKDKITAILSHTISQESVLENNTKIVFEDKTQENVEIIQEEPITNGDPSNLVSFKLAQPIEPEFLPANLEIEGWKSGPLILREILNSDQYRTNEKLGVTVSNNKTNFKVFAPGASKVILNIYNQAFEKDGDSFSLQKLSNGVWTKEIKEDLTGQYYTYQVKGPDPSYNFEAELIDPYARATTAHDGRGIIIKDSIDIASPPNFSIDEAIIYEMHIRDFTIAQSSGVEKKGKFPGFHEEGTRIPGTDISTGIDHLKELGINTVQIMPIQDFEHKNEGTYYSWGYMPVNFNAPDGWLATSYMDGGGVEEFKQLVSTLHKNGIKVVMDVVYNHTAENSHDKYYNFNGFAPHFYYREKLDGTLWNGSGTGNEVRTENPMVSSFILDSLKYWVNEYGVDGFRFDLMGLIDIKTMERIVKELHYIKPDIFIYGEPWTAGETPIAPTTKGKQKGRNFGVFNDNFRDAIKGPWHASEPGYIQAGSHSHAIKQGILGSIHDFTDSPTEVINYVTCHDGKTLWDRIIATTKDNPQLTEPLLKSMHKLAATLILTSQGIPFIHGGQEILRTKYGSDNSYNLPDHINKIRWQNKKQNYDIFQYYQGLIELRKKHPMFRFHSKKEIKKNINFLCEMGYQLPENCIGYKIMRGGTDDEWSQALVLFNPHYESKKLSIPKKRWNLVVNNVKAGTEFIAPVSGGSIKLPPISAMVMYHL